MNEVADRRILVVFATRQGQTRKVAERIVDHLREAGATVTLHHAGDAFEAGEYDVVAYGGSMHAGGVERELIRFIERHHDTLAPRFTAFFLVLLSAATKDPELRATSLRDAREKLDAQLAGRSFDHIEMIAGALSYSKYPWPLKWLMQRIARQAGGDTDTSRDYEYTDWQQVARFARLLADGGPAAK